MNASSLENSAEWGVEKRQMERDYLRLHRELSAAKKKAGIAHDQRIVAISQAAELRIRCRVAENGLKVLEQDAHPFRWLKKIGSDAAVAVLKPWETDAWDHVVDRARGHIR